MFVGQTVKYHGEKGQLNTEKVRHSTFTVGWEFAGHLLDHLFHFELLYSNDFKDFLHLDRLQPEDMQATGPIIRWESKWQES